MLNYYIEVIVIFLFNVTASELKNIETNQKQWNYTCHKQKICRKRN